MKKETKTKRKSEVLRKKAFIIGIIAGIIIVTICIAFDFYIYGHYTFSFIQSIIMLALATYFGVAFFEINYAKSGVGKLQNALYIGKGKSGKLSSKALKAISIAISLVIGIIVFAVAYKYAPDAYAIVAFLFCPPFIAITYFIMAFNVFKVDYAIEQEKREQK